ncbi:NADAR family protein [Persicimonas caeni]|uniref:NADAR family protein n=1 Tax=Persicimonas caeni TaxID=2292766 RepID=UPI001580EC81|nr:NADAR family protein [Persicimonas caeni]
MADETIRFFHLEEPYGCLSNASRHGLFLDGTYWPTVEHYFQTGRRIESARKAVDAGARAPRN